MFHGHYIGSALIALRLEACMNIFCTQSGKSSLRPKNEMSEKKRKRHEDRPDGRPSKKIARECTSQKIQVSVIEDDEWVPVLGECS